MSDSDKFNLDDEAVENMTYAELATSQAPMTTDEKLEELMIAVQRTGQALLGHDTVRIVPDMAERARANDAARAALREYVSAKIEEAEQNGIRVMSRVVNEPPRRASMKEPVRQNATRYWPIYGLDNGVGNTMDCLNCFTDFTPAAEEPPELKEALLEYAQYIAALTQGRPLTAYQQQGLPSDSRIRALYDRQREETERLQADSKHLTEAWATCERLESQVASLSSQLERLTKDSEVGVICRWCGELQSGVEAGARVRWVVCPRCDASEIKELRESLERLKAEQSGLSADQVQALVEEAYSKGLGDQLTREQAAFLYANTRTLVLEPEDKIAFSAIAALRRLSQSDTGDTNG